MAKILCNYFGLSMAAEGKSEFVGRQAAAFLGYVQQDAERCAENCGCAEDLNDAPEEIKREILRNDEELRRREQTAPGVEHDVVAIYDNAGIPSIMHRFRRVTNKELFGGSDAVHPAFIIGGEVYDEIYISVYENTMINGKPYSLPLQEPVTNITMVIHADDSGIWLGTRSALYNATELPEMEGKEQVGAVLDIDSKAWEKMFFDEKYAETGGAAFGMNLTDADPLEQEARRVPLEMFYKGMGLVGLMYGNAGELIFYDSALIAPIADVVKNSDYIQTVVRKTAGGAPYVVIKDGFEVLAGFAPLKIITKQFLEDLSEFESACVSQYMREQKQALDAADPDKQDEGAEQIGMEDAESENE